MAPLSCGDRSRLQATFPEPTLGTSTLQNKAAHLKSVLLADTHGFDERIVVCPMLFPQLVSGYRGQLESTRLAPLFVCC